VVVTLPAECQSRFQESHGKFGTKKVMDSRGDMRFPLLMS
jgi:hypothetical protein